MSEAASRAVFLSYARDDAAAARRIAEALRASGLEVWFDEHELRGGDAWDAKIRQQIDACALFVAVISRHTQERSKGYFRLEWKLAVDQTHLLAAGVPFIAPVVIDDTPEGGALVPPEFMRVQWMRLPGALPTPQFVEQVKRLLEAPPKQAGVSLDDARGRAQGAPLQRKSLPGWTWGAAAALLGAAGIGYFLLRPPVTPPAAAVIAPSPVPAPSSLPPGPARPPQADAKSVAVLPLANLSAEGDNAFFADGMHDDLITALAKVRDLKVISRTSVLPYRTGERNLRKIAAELGVAAILEGSVQRAGNRVRINVQLIDAATDNHLWAETYNRELTDIFSLQADLVQQIAAALKATLSGGETALLARRPTQSQAAYDLYLRARVLDDNLGTGAARDSYEQVISLYEQAAAADPSFVLPHVQASILHGTLYWFTYYDQTPARRALAAAALEKARQLAPEAPETRLAEGSFEYTCNNDWRKALETYQLAEAGLPNNAQLQYRIGLAHRRLGQWSAALQSVQNGIALNPNDLNGAAAYLELVMALRRYREVMEQVGVFEARFPNEAIFQTIRSNARYELDGDRAAWLRRIDAVPASDRDKGGWQKEFFSVVAHGDVPTAERMLADRREVLMPGDTMEPVALARARFAWLQGRPADAKRFAEEALAVSRGQSPSPRRRPDVQLDLAEALALAGRIDEAVPAAEAAMAAARATDGFAYVNNQLSAHGRILLICGRPDEALGVLRNWVAGPGAHPHRIRHDLFWSRLKDDPRFEEILRSAKPL